jgi:hypothetical protein
MAGSGHTNPLYIRVVVRPGTRIGCCALRGVLINRQPNADLDGLLNVRFRGPLGYGILSSAYDDWAATNSNRGVVVF